MSRSPSPVIRRAPRTYGRRRDTSEHDISFDVGNTSIDSREDSLSSTSLPLDHEMPPSSDDFDASNTSSVSAHAQDADDSDSNASCDKGASRYKFAWRIEMDNIDAETSETLTQSGEQEPHGKLSEGIASVPTRPASPADLAAQDAFSGTLSSVTSSAQSSSQIIHKRTPRRLEVLPSEPESEAEARPSTPATSPRHPINTPQTRSSPTPPTSIEMPPNKGKGKQREAEPLPLESADDLTSSAKLATAKRQRKPRASGAAKRVKAPTKKEQIETRKATARITAQQTVSIKPVQQNKIAISTLLERLKQNLVAAPPSRSKSRSRSPPIPLPSDPIQAFSSSPAADRQSQRPTASSSKAASQSEFVPNGLLGRRASFSDSSSDEELPDMAQLLRERQKARDVEENIRRAREMKAQAVAQQRQDASEYSDDDLVIEDDPKNVARDEAQSRRGLSAKGVLPSRSRQKHLTLARTGGPRESKMFFMDEEESRHFLVETTATSSFLAPKAKAKGKPVQMDPKTLNMLLLAQDDKVKVRTIKEKEEDYKRRGGRIKERPEEHAATHNPQEALERIAERRRALGNRHEDVEMVHDSGSDEEYRPDDAVDHEGSQQSEEENDEDGENAPPSLSRGDPGEQADDEDDENPFLAPRPRRTLANKPVVVVVSDDEEDSENRPPPSRVLVRDSSFARPSHSPQLASDAVDEDQSFGRRRSMSSLGDQTEDGTDKENDVRLSFDRGDDKENTVIAVQSPGRSLPLSRGFGSLFAAELQASPAGRSAVDGARSPLKELPADDEDEDPFTFSPGPLLLSNSATAAAREDSPMGLNLSGGSGLQEAFSLSGKGKERAPSPSPLPLAEAFPIGGGGGFSQFFTQEGGGGFEKLKVAQHDDDISLTLDPGPQPMLEIDLSLVKKADQIFEKEQELAVQEQQVVRKEPTPEMFVDENGFLTQTRPELRTPLSMMTPSQPMPSLRLSSPATLLASVRKPLAPLLTQGPDDDDDLPRRRLKKRDRTPPLLSSSSQPKNAFEVLGRRPASPKAKRPIRSAFIEGEAEESDEDAAFGFGGKRQDDDDEDSDDDTQDQPLPGLVDDKEMDDQTLAQQAVLEKHREHEELDDKAREKAARDAATGKLRVKRRDRGIGFEDSDSDDGSDDGRRARPANKKPRLNDSIAALSKDKETAPFAHEYSANVDDDDNEFAYLKQDDIEMDVPEPEEEEEEPREVISHAQLREEMLQRARESDATPVFNPHDVSRWDDGSEDEMDSDMRVREVSLDQRRDAAARLTMNNDADEPNRKGETMREEDRQRMAKWVKAESASRTAGIVGRSTGGSTAVTGHSKSKAGSGSFKEPQRPSVSSSANASGRSKVAKAPSVLSAVSNRRAKFAN